MGVPQEGQYLSFVFTSTPQFGQYGIAAAIIHLDNILSMALSLDYELFP